MEMQDKQPHWTPTEAEWKMIQQGIDEMEAGKCLTLNEALVELEALKKRLIAESEKDSA